MIALLFIPLLFWRAVVNRHTNPIRSTGYFGWMTGMVVFVGVTGPEFTPVPFFAALLGAIAWALVYNENSPGAKEVQAAVAHKPSPSVPATTWQKLCACQATNDPDAAFCKKCGSTLGS